MKHKDTLCKKITPTYFDNNINKLRQAAQEGRLYIKVSCQKSSNCQENILQYVSRINHLASPKFVPIISKIWQQIVNHPEIGSTLFIQRGKNNGQINKYRITNLVVFLHGIGVYQDHLTPTQLHLSLEDTTCRNLFYTNHEKYGLARCYYQLITAMIDELTRID